MSCRFLSLALATLVVTTSVLAKPAAEDPEHIWGRSARGTGSRGPRLPDQFQPQPGGRHNVPRHPGRPRGECTCSDPRMEQVERNIADLVRRVDDMESQSKQDGVKIQSLQDSNRRQQTRISQVVGENQRLTRLTRSLQSRAETLDEDNSELRAENERLLGERDQPKAVRDDPQVNPRSSVRDLNDVMGNREAEMIEMGVFPPMRPPARPEGPSVGRERGTTFSSGLALPDSERIATSLLAMNQENEIMKRRLGQLEGRMNQQDRPVPLPGAARGKSGPQLRPVPVPPPGQSPEELSEKISQLERLVLVALRTPSDQQSGGLQVMRPRPEGEQGPAGPLGSGARGSTAKVAAVDTTAQMNDDDLEAMADVVERVRNKSPAKSAFSVASTRILLGAADDPRAIEFDHEYVNKGGDFNMRRNRFVCETPGFYYVTFTLRSYDNKYLGVALMKNEELQTSVYSDKSERNVMQTQAVILQLEPGDELWLRHAPSEHFAVHSGEHRFVTFSGYLIYRGR